ncbi:MAG: NifU N-terminal domain-containing protein [Actinomycetia bacterium]|nr:NifU N-terminal domain-containing protein [Actinomycetes bacterium]
MPVVVETTPNPRAMKFTVGASVGGPATYTDSGSADPRVAPLLGITGVVSVFATGDFVTITRDESSAWDDIVPAATEILERSFA